MKKLYDFIIVGAGPAGSLLAHLLAKQGLQTLLLERRPTFVRKVCGEYLCPKGVRLLQDLNLHHVISGDLPLWGMNIFTSNETEVKTSFPCFQDNTVAKGVAVNRKNFDEKLYKQAIDSGSHGELGVNVLSVKQEMDYWILETNKGAYRAKALIGADGRSSVISKYFNNDILLTEKRVALHCYVHSKESFPRFGEMHLFDDAAYIGIDPTGDTEINFSLVLDADKLKTLGSPLDAMNHYIAKSKNLTERFGLLQAGSKVTAAYPLSHKVKSVIPAHGVALIGDAAGFVDPLTGEGMYNALQSAMLLADAVADNLKTSLVLQEKLFKAYEASYSKILSQKSVVNRAFQWVIRHPRIVEAIAQFLLKNEQRRNAFIGLIGNIYSPGQGLLKLIK